MKFKIDVDNSRDNLLTDFGKATLDDRYLQTDESYQSLFERVSTFYADDQEHAQRLYDYMSQLWFMPATPILSNGGTDKGLSISCFLNNVGDSLESIVDTWSENVWLASNGGGIGSYWGNLRSLGEQAGSNAKSKTCGIIPFVKVQDALTLAISQGMLRRGSAAAYIPVNHPEIEEFLKIRKPTGGDPNRKTPNIHQGICIDDKFMHAVEKDEKYDLISPKDGTVIESISARNLWIEILTTRMETGEPYLLFIDTVNDNKPESYSKLGLKTTTSNLCSEIVLHTGPDHLDNDRTAVCCLSSVNLAHYEKWCDNELFIEDIMRFLDNVLEDFIDSAPETMKNAVYAAKRERSVGLGAMGFHNFLQDKMIPYDSVMATSWTRRMFENIRTKADAASITLAEEKGPCLDAEECGIMERFTHKLSVAPTASISIICGGSSPCIEPLNANIYTQKTLSGSFTVKNRCLEALLESKGKNIPSVWSRILREEGSVQGLTCLTDDEKEIFKTALEIDSMWVIELAAHRQEFLDQTASINLFLLPNTSKYDLNKIHFQAWKRGLKSLYYCRSQSGMRAEKITQKVEYAGNNNTDDPYDECLSCQ